MTKVFLATLLIFSAGHCFGDIAIIAHPSANTSNLTQETVRDLYLGNRQYVAQTRFIPLDQDGDSKIRQVFYERLIDKPENQVISHWSRLIFTGKGQAPISLTGDNSIIQFVKNNPNVIGYVDKDFVDETIKVVFVLNE